MKKLIFIIAAVLLTTGAFAQKGFYYGVKAGVNISNISNYTDWYGSDTKSQVYTGFYAGAFAEYRFGNVVGLQLEAMYSRQGDRVKQDKSDYKYIGGEKMDYINVPLILKIYPIKKLSIEIGPQFGFVVGAKYMSKYVGTDGDRWVEKDTESLYSSDYKTFDLSLAMGVSYQLTDMLEVTARYNMGFTKMFSDDYDNAGDYGPFKNRVLQIGMGLRF